MEQISEPMSAEESCHAEKQRSWVRDHFEQDSRHKYDTVEGKLRLIQTILNAGWIKPPETWKLQSLGISLGDALVQDISLEWIIVEDEYGRNPALKMEGSTIVIFPLTAISKRVERGEKVNVRELFDEFRQMIDEKLSQGF